MGKKHVIRKTGEDLLKERKAVDTQLGQDSPQGVSSRRIGEGRIYIAASYNNTIMTLTDTGGNVLKIVSAGALGFKGARKATPFAASKITDAVALVAQQRGVERVTVFAKGIGPGRESALRALANKPLEITAVQDITPIPHNGPTPKKPRRV